MDPSDPERGVPAAVWGLIVFVALLSALTVLVAKHAPVSVEGQVEAVYAQELEGGELLVAFTLEDDARLFTYSTATGMICDLYGPTGGCFDRGHLTLARLERLGRVRFRASPQGEAEVKHWRVRSTVSTPIQFANEG